MTRVIIAMLLGVTSACTTPPLLAQDHSNPSWQLIDSIELQHHVTLFSKDRVDNLYLAYANGTISKLDKDGMLIANYAPQQFAHPTVMESWASLRLFVFFENTQQYTFLDRFLSGAQLTEFPATLGFVSLATATSNNQLWVIDERGFRLLRYDFEFDQVVVERSFNQLPQALNLQPYQIKEYQNRLYVGDKAKGILVFDNLGNFLHIMEVDPLYFAFIGEELYYLKQHKLMVHDLYGNAVRQIDLPLSQPQWAQWLGDRLALIKDQQLFIYAYNP